MTRARLLPPGRTELRGRAWSGRAAIARVEVSMDDGGSWQEATVAAALPRGRGTHGDSRGTRRRASTSCRFGRPTRSGMSSPTDPDGTSVATRTTRRSGYRSRCEPMSGWTRDSLGCAAVDRERRTGVALRELFHLGRDRDGVAKCSNARLAVVATPTEIATSGISCSTPLRSSILTNPRSRSSGW